MAKTHYELGNCLRGFFSGEFETDDEAWEALGKRFDESFPSRDGRTVLMTKTVRKGKTEGGNETEEDRRDREAAEAVLARRQAREQENAA